MLGRFLGNLLILPLNSLKNGKAIGDFANSAVNRVRRTWPSQFECRTERAEERLPE